MNSLRVRLLLISTLSIGVVLAAASFAMVALFEKNVERRVEAELTNYVNQIAAELSFDKDGKLNPPKSLSDRRFSQAYSGLYWQIDDEQNKHRLRSRSLWDYALPLPDDSHGPGEVHRYFLPGPDGSTVIIEERELIVAAPNGVRPIRITAAMNYDTVKEARSEFALDIFPYILVLGFILLLTSFAQLVLGLRPLKRVRAGLDAVRNRQILRLPENFPVEINPLAQAVNQLLDAQEETITRARKRAADLAHGLNSPLTVLNNDAAKLMARGETEIANELILLSRNMRAHIDFELARSRITPEPAQRRNDGSPYLVAMQIIKILQRTPKGEKIHWQLSIPQNLFVSVDQEDLRELIGNILENALKWSQSFISVSGFHSADQLTISIEDDGDGLDPRLIETMLNRGVRHDQTAEGSGIGLSLVKEICEINNIKLTIENRQTSGLCVTLAFPLANGADQNNLGSGK